jgi:hypothetical protein
MIRTILFAAALTLSMFSASATAAPAAPTRIEASGGSYGFMRFGSCTSGVVSSACPQICMNAYKRYRPGITPPSTVQPQWCFNKADTGKRTPGAAVFRQGKFLSK